MVRLGGSGSGSLIEPVTGCWVGLQSSEGLTEVGGLLLYDLLK